MKKYLKISLLVFVVAMVLVFSLDVFSGNPKNEGFFAISAGDNILQISNNLHRQGYIASKLFFVFDVIKSGEYRKMKAGKYYINKGATNEDLIKKFVRSQSVAVNILIAPGKTTNDVAKILSQNNLATRDEFLNIVLNRTKASQGDFYSSISKKYSFLADKPKSAGLEGYLFPDSYLINYTAADEKIVEQILDNFDKKLTAGMREEIKKQNKTVFQVLTMASILEKVVKTYSDKQIVSGILWKRADNNLPLEVDSTLLYFLTSQHPSLIDKNVDSPYNTYNNIGLPIGPICNPGEASIMAAIYYKNTDYWFYLSAPSGETIFANTLGQHLINKAKYLQ